MIVEFLIIAEAGVLEKQSLLLCESIRQFGGRYARAKITILQPRRERKISPEGRLRFAALQAQVIELAIVSPCPEYGTSYRVFACAEYERSATSDNFIFLDSDAVLLAEPDFELQGADVAARPVDVKGMCTAGAGDANEEYWRTFCHVCGVDYEKLPFVSTTVERAKVRASYNGGLTVVKTRAGLFQKTADFFMRSLHANLVPWPDRVTSFTTGHGVVSAEGSRLWGSSQASLSLAITALGLSVRTLPASQNFPLHLYNDLLPEIRKGTIPTVSHVHYHHIFRGPPQENPILAGMPGFPAGSIEWLEKRTEQFA
jgi:hypothetical protein